MFSHEALWGRPFDCIQHSLSHFFEGCLIASTSEQQKTPANADVILEWDQMSTLAF